MAAGAPVSGKVTDVVEGNILLFEHDGTVETIRLADIDCPEMAQAHGKEAREFTAGLVLGKEVSVDASGTDTRKRPLAVVILGDGRVLNRELASGGYAWFYDRYPNVDPTIPGLMAAARAAQKGLWADAAPLAPWDFRGDALKEKTKKTIEMGHDSGLPSGGAVFIDKDGKEFHKLDCVMLDKQSRHSVMLKDAQAQGYVPCRKCFPIKPQGDTTVVTAKGNLGDVPKEEFPKETPRPAPPPSTPAGKAAPVAVGDFSLPPEIGKYMDDPIVRSLGLEPYRDPNGNFAGIAAKNISSFLPAALYGFQDGDVLHSVNGNVLNNPNDIPALIEKYKNTRSFQVGIIRNGQPMAIDVTIPDFIK